MIDWSGLSDTQVTLLVGLVGAAAAITAGAVGQGMAYLLQKRSRWDVERHKALAAVTVTVHELWDGYDDDGVPDCPVGELEERRIRFNEAYVLAGMLVKHKHTDDKLDDLHNAIGYVINRRGRAWVDAERTLHDSLTAYMNAARAELGLKKIAYDGYSTMSEDRSA